MSRCAPSARRANASRVIRLETVELDLPSGTMLGKYEIVRKLAVGGMAEIYLARARGVAGFEKYVVLKRILPTVAKDPAFVRMFLEEAIGPMIPSALALT